MSETTVESRKAFDFLRMNEREGKPRSRGITEIRAPTTRQWASATSLMCWRPWASTWTR
jgi:hypothetical protein